MNQMMTQRDLWALAISCCLLGIGMIGASYWVLWKWFQDQWRV